MKLYPILAIGALLAAGPVSAGTINVPADQPTIQAAINVAVNGDTVLVAPGTYYEKLNFNGKAITVKSSGGAAVTILDGNNGGPIVEFGDSEGNASVIEGFTLQHGASGLPGSAIALTNASPKIIGNIFADNIQAVGYWGAAIGGNGASPVIIGNLFTRNSCDTQLLSGVVATVNASSPVIVDNVFLDNACRAVNMTLPTQQAPYVSNNTFVGNSVGIRVDARVVTSKQIYRNNLLYGNTVGLEVDFGSAANYPTWKNNLVYNSITADYQGITDQTGTKSNISVDPLFRDIADGSFKLSWGSPAIDVADMGSPALPGTDFYGDSRVFDGDADGMALPDIGAAEYHPPLVSGTDGIVSTTVGTAVDSTLGSTGADPGEPVIFVIATQPVHGTLILMDSTNGAFHYVPGQGYVGTDSFTFNIVDPYGTESSQASEQISVVDIPPSAHDGSVTTTPDQTGHGTLVASAAYPGQILDFSLVSNPAHGVVHIERTNGRFVYVPVVGFAGADSFTFQVSDSNGATTAVLTESVMVADVAPKAVSAFIRTPSRKALSGTFNANAAYAGQLLTFSVVSPPSHGTVSIIDPSTGAFTYSAVRQFRGRDSFSFHVTDQWGKASNIATVFIYVH